MLELQMHEAHLLRRQKLTVSQIADELGRSERTVYYYLSQSPRPRKKRTYASKLDSFKPYIDSVIRKHTDYNREVLFRDLKKVGYDGGITILREYAAKVAEIENCQAVIRFETIPGHQAQVDWKDAGRRTVNGERKKVYAFNMAMGYSRAPFTVHTTSMDQAMVLACHDLAFRHFGGVPHEILYDNMKTAFIRDTEGRWRPNKHLLRLANHYGFIPRRCRVRRPQTKGKVERYIKTYSNGFLRYLEDGLSLDAMNERVGAWIDGLMDRPMRELGSTRRERFTEDQKALLPLPARPFNARREKSVRVGRESLITFETNRYSVPPRFIGRNLIVKVHPLDGDIAVYDGPDLIRELPRPTGKRGVLWRPEDREAVMALWKKQSGPHAPRPSEKADATDVQIRSPEAYERLMEVPA